MSRVPQSIVNPQDPQSIVEHLYRVQRVVDGRVEFGSPQDPRDPASTTVANGTAHNGTILNVQGSWFTAVIEAVGRTDVICIHNLFDSTFTPSAGLVPVRWLPFAWRHSGTGGGVATELDLAVWYMGGAVAFDRITLAFSVNVIAGALTINAANPVRVDLFFTQAVR